MPPGTSGAGGQADLPVGPSRTVASGSWCPARAQFSFWLLQEPV